MSALRHHDHTSVIYESGNGIINSETTSSCSDILSITRSAEYTTRVLELAPVSPKCGFVCEIAGPSQRLSAMSVAHRIVRSEKNGILSWSYPARN
jgi:hypothetical protein